MAALLQPKGRRRHCGALFFPSGQSERTEPRRIGTSNPKGQTVAALQASDGTGRRIHELRLARFRRQKRWQEGLTGRVKGGISTPPCEATRPPPFGHRFIGIKEGKGNLRRAAFLPPLSSRSQATPEPPHFHARVSGDSPPITTPGPSAAKRAEWRGRSTRRESFPPA